MAGVICFYQYGHGAGQSIAQETSVFDLHGLRFKMAVRFYQRPGRLVIKEVINYHLFYSKK